MKWIPSSFQKILLYKLLLFHFVSRLTNQIVALKEIRLQAEEGAPFTAIREGMLWSCDVSNQSDCNTQRDSAVEGAPFTALSRLQLASANRVTALTSRDGIL